MPHILKSLALSAALLCPCGLAADPLDDMRDATVALDRSIAALEQAASARDRERALTGIVAALETGLAGLRAEARAAGVREENLRVDLSARDQDIAALFVALQQTAPAPHPLSLLHPAGPLGAARAGMTLSAVLPALAEDAKDIRDELQHLNDLRRAREAALRSLAAGRDAVQTARAELGQTIAARTDPPLKFTQDPVREAILIASSETLAQFAANLDRVPHDLAAATSTAPAPQPGTLPWPAVGTRLPHDADIPGVTLATGPAALVQAPVAATIRYAGPLLDYGQVVLLELDTGLLLVLAGLGTVYRTAGEMVDAGAALGLVGQTDASDRVAVSTDGEGAGAQLTERLYIEVRRDTVPEDPTLWFRTDKDG